MEKAIKEVRLRDLRASDNEGKMIIEGYASVFDEVTDLGWCKEKVSRSAFENCDMSDVCMKYNHGDSKFIMARTRNGSLKLDVDTHGLKVSAELIDTQDNRDLYKMIQERLLEKMSFAFTVRLAEWDYETDLRDIKEIDKLYDVSVVDVPAYDGTEVYARSKEDYEKEKEAYRNRKQLELEKEKLKLKASI